MYVRNFFGGGGGGGGRGGISAPVCRKALALNKHSSTDLDHHLNFTLRTKSEGENVNLITFQRMPMSCTPFQLQNERCRSIIGYPNCVPSPGCWQFASLLCCRNEYKYEVGGYSVGVTAWFKLLQYVTLFDIPVYKKGKHSRQCSLLTEICLYISSYQPLLRSSGRACWSIELTCLNLRTTCSCSLRLSTVLCTRHRSGGAKLPSAVSFHFKRFHFYKKHKFYLWKPFDISRWKRLMKSHTTP